MLTADDPYRCLATRGRVDHDLDGAQYCLCSHVSLPSSSPISVVETRGRGELGDTPGREGSVSLGGS